MSKHQKITKTREINLLKICDVLAKVKFSKAKLYRLIKAKKFPPAIKIDRGAFWPDYVVNDWLTQKAEIYEFST